MKTIMLILASFLTAASLGVPPECDIGTADKNDDGRISLKEYKKNRAIIMKKEGWSDPYHQIKSMFKERDSDGDGYLTREELDQAVACSRLKDGFSKRDGRLTFNQFEIFVERMLEDQGQYALQNQFSEAFRLQDYNGDGKLSRDEFVTLPVQLVQRFQLADEDRNYELDIDEFAVFAVGKENLALLADNSDVYGWVENIFENRDDDEDEYLTREELYESSAERHQRFSHADENGDGLVDLTEIQAFKVSETDLSLWQDVAMDQFRLNFISRDLNADGIITAAEYFNKTTPPGMQLAFSAIK